MPESWFSLNTWNSEREREGPPTADCCLWRLVHSTCTQSHLYMTEWAFEVNWPKSALASRWTRTQRPKRPPKNDSGRQGYLSDIRNYVSLIVLGQKKRGCPTLGIITNYGGGGGSSILPLLKQMETLFIKVSIKNRLPSTAHSLLINWFIHSFWALGIPSFSSPKLACSR